jgi:anti-sigma factor RsiW
VKVTRDVIIDLWAAYVSGEASGDSRALVDEFLRDDPAFAEELRRPSAIEPAAAPAPPPDMEAQALTRTRRRLRGYRPLLTLALVFTGLAFGRIVSDTAWQVSPRNFIATAAVAVAFWIAFFVALWRMRVQILVAPRDPGGDARRIG